MFVKFKLTNVAGTNFDLINNSRVGIYEYHHILTRKV